MTHSYFSDLDKSSENESENSYFSDLPEPPSKTRSLLSALPKGLIKGAAKFSPLPSFGPIPLELGERATEQVLPTREGTAEDILQFTGENIPFALGGEGGLVKKGLQSVAGALAKKGAKEVNLPEWAQDIVGGIGMLSTDLLKAVGSKTLRPSIKQAEMVDFLKSHGFSDKDITPIIQNKKLLSFVSKAASKYEKKDPWLKGIQKKLGDIFENIRGKGRDSGYLQGNDLNDFETEFYKRLNKIPKMYRRLIDKEVEDLFSNPIDFTELHDFNKAVNAIVRDVEGGKAAIGILKEPVELAQKTISPSLFKELQQTNKAYSKLYDFTDKMTKKNWDSLISLGQAGQALYGLLTLNPVALKTAGLVAVGKLSAKEFLSNPRLQNIHLKMWDAFLKNNIPQALKLMALFEEEAKKSKSINNPHNKEIGNESQK